MNIIESNLKFTRRPTKRRITDMIVIHHTASRDVSSQTIHNVHLRNGWIGNGYHFLIRANGNVETGRPHRTIGAHVSGFNSRSIGVGIVGNFMTRLPSIPQLEALAELLEYIKTLYPDINRICVHKDLDATLCPGTKFHEWIMKQEWYNG